MAINNKYSNYLPSKNFTYVMVAAVVVVILFVVISSLLLNKEKFTNKQKDAAALLVQNQTIIELMQNDTDHDSLEDWEEALWGTDKNNKTTFGMPDAEYVEGKRNTIKADQSLSEIELTETDKFARQFFASYAAMKASGQIDATTINNFSNSLGQQIANPNLTNIYSEKDLRTDSNESTDKNDIYAQQMIDLLDKYQASGVGDELSIMSNGLNMYTINGQPNQYDDLQKIGDSYKAFARELMSITVPKSLATYHLNIANNANNSGESILNMAKVIVDPLVGLSGISLYEKYNKDLIDNLNAVEKILLETTSE